jgi:hypothetical protein
MNSGFKVASTLSSPLKGITALIEEAGKSTDIYNDRRATTAVGRKTVR